MIYSKGKFMKISAELTLGRLGDEPTKVTVADGDELTDLVVAAGNYGSTEEKTYATAKVLGFTAKPIDVRRGAIRSYDGVPMRIYDPNGGQYRGFVQEVVEVRDLIIENEDGESVRINVENILSVNVPVDEEETTTPPGDD